MYNSRIEVSGVHTASDINSELKRELALLEAQEQKSNEKGEDDDELTTFEQDFTSPNRIAKVRAADNIHNDVELLAAQISLKREELELEEALEKHLIAEKHRRERRDVEIDEYELRRAIGESEDAEFFTCLSCFDSGEKIVQVKIEQRHYQERKAAELEEWTRQANALDEMDKDFLAKDKHIYNKFNEEKKQRDVEGEREEREHMAALKTRVIDDDDELVKEPYQMHYLFFRSTKQMY